MAMPGKRRSNITNHSYAATPEKVREEFIALGEANTQSWEHLLDELKGIYTPAKEAAKAPANAGKEHHQGAGQEGNGNQGRLIVSSPDRPALQACL
jgi:hypothetical protein